MHDNVITVVIPTYNEKRELLKKAIDTVMDQTYPRIELIVVDDGSTDGTSEFVRKNYGDDLILLRRERTSAFRSVSEAFNLGMQHATGDWWHHDAADCWHDPEWGERVIASVMGRDDVYGAHTDFEIHRFNGSVDRVRVAEVWRPEKTSFDNYMEHEALGGMIFDMPLCKKAGEWDTRFPRKQTREWTMRVMYLGCATGKRLAHVPKSLWHFEFHEEDQMKRRASVKFRLLGDLKNGWDINHNMKIALGSEDGRYAFADAFRTFFTDPEWQEESTCGATISRIDRVKQICDEEASEDWDGKRG